MLDTDLDQRCKACEGGVAPLGREQVQKYLKELQDWKADSTYSKIEREYEFNNYYEVISFVNASAWISHNENHHPDLSVSYKTCRVTYTTHAINGLSINDFICAKKIDILLTVNI